MTNSADPVEIQAFSKDAAHWWDENGPFRPLHKINPVRMRYIREQLCSHFELDRQALNPFTDLKVLDVGCGGGLASESMARLGARVTGIDADEKAIETARAHAKDMGLKLEYLTSTVEKANSRQTGHYNAILALEIIEHVNSPADFVTACSKLLKPGGMIIFSTLNRTAKSYALGIVAAEYILRWIPHGTHSWKKFVKPSELARFARQNRLNVCDISGMIFNPLQNNFQISKKDIDVNYLMTAIKN